MTRRYTLAPLQAMHFTPPQLVALSADVGAWGCGVRLLPVTPGAAFYPLHQDAPMLRETLACMADRGVTMFDLELVRMVPGLRIDELLPVFDVGQRLGARVLNVIGSDPEPQRLVDTYGALCDAAARFGLSCDVEPVPWAPVATVRDARRLLEAADRPNMGILIDALHWSRSDSSLDDVRTLPRHWLHYAQICDGRLPAPPTHEALIHDARHERLLPGEGDIDLAGLFAALPADVPMCVEVPNDGRAAQIGHAAWARASVEASRALLER